MIRTQIQLPDEDYRRLREEAVRQGRSMADCIREGIALFLVGAEGARRGLEEVPAFRSISTEDLKDHDRWWVEAIADESSPRP